MSNNENKIPTIVISNIAETFIDFLGRSENPLEREELINSEAYLLEFRVGRTLTKMELADKVFV